MNDTAGDTTSETCSAQSGQPGPFLGICTDRVNGEVRFVVSAASVAEVKAKMDAALDAACDPARGETFEPFVWEPDAASELVIEWATNGTDDYAQIVTLP